MDQIRDEWIAKFMARNPAATPLAAQEAWEAVTPETKAVLMNIADSRRRASIAIQNKLLTALVGFPESASLKEPFRMAIMNLPHP
jgi:hypothetical protein